MNWKTLAFLMEGFIFLLMGISLEDVLTAAGDQGFSIDQAILYGALAVPTLVLFFSGTPGMFGATAAFLAGLTRDRQPEAGVPRAFGVLGLVVAILNILVTVLGVAIAWIAD